MHRLRRRLGLALLYQIQNMGKQGFSIISPDFDHRNARHGFDPVGEGHTAAMVYLPDYKKASLLFEVAGESGWVWAEATGGNNQLGWAPKEFIDVKLAAYEITDEEPNLESPVDSPSIAIARTGGGGSFSMPFPFFSVLFLLWILPMFRRRQAR